MLQNVSSECWGSPTKCTKVSQKSELLLFQKSHGAVSKARWFSTVSKDIRKSRNKKEKTGMCKEAGVTDEVVYVGSDTADSCMPE